MERLIERTGSFTYQTSLYLRTAAVIERQTPVSDTNANLGHMFGTCLNIRRFIFIHAKNGCALKLQGRVLARQMDLLKLHERFKLVAVLMPHHCCLWGLLW